MMAQDLSQPTVMVLDDEPAVRDSLRDLLESAHYDVRLFSSPCEFLQSKLPRQRACLLLDLRMPDVHGLDVLQALRKVRPKLPTIVLTAYAEVPSVVSAMKFGAVNFLEKPCSDSDLLAAVRDAIAQSDRCGNPAARPESVQDKLDQLSLREREVLKQLISGRNVKQIALQLGTSPNTVRNQRSRILEKMGVSSVTELVRLVLEAG